jgi:hypothetical protein
LQFALLYLQPRRDRSPRNYAEAALPGESAAIERAMADGSLPA